MSYVVIILSIKLIYSRIFITKYSKWISDCNLDLICEFLSIED
jgi:hypothetical protein